METARTIGDNIDTTGCIAEHGGFVELQFFDLDVSKSFSIWEREREVHVGRFKGVIVHAINENL